MRNILGVVALGFVLVACQTTSKDTAQNDYQQSAGQKKFGVASARKLPKKAYSLTSLQNEVSDRCENGPTRKPNYGRAAARQMVKMGWSLIKKNDAHRASEVFLSALFIGPERPDAYWGLGVASHINNFSMSIIDACFERAKLKIKGAPGLFSDYGRILEERNSINDAIESYKKSLAIDDNYIEAHKGLYRSYKQINDTVNSTVHKNRIDELLKVKKVG